GHDVPRNAILDQPLHFRARYVQEDHFRIRQRRRNLQIKFVRPLSGQNEFVAYIDAIGRLDNQRCLLEWKTTSSRYPEEPDGLLEIRSWFAIPGSPASPKSSNEFSCTSAS